MYSRFPKARPLTPELAKARAEGKELQRRHRHMFGGWMTFMGDELWPDHDHRIKPPEGSLRVGRFKNWGDTFTYKVFKAEGPQPDSRPVSPAWCGWVTDWYMPGEEPFKQEPK
jgi:hypothetical protein